MQAKSGNDCCAWLRSMCLFIQNQNFQAHTEHMMNTLYDGARMVQALLESIAPAMEQQSSQIKGINQQLVNVSQTQVLLSSEMQQSAENLHQLSRQAQLLEAGIQTSLANEVRS